MQKKYFVSGMKGAACGLAVERAAFRSGIVLGAAANLRNHSLTVILFDNCLNEEPLYQTVRKAGYTLSAYRAPAVKKHKLNFLFFRMLFSVVLLLPLLSISLGQSAFFPVPDVLSDQKICVLLQSVLALSIAVLNAEYFVKGYTGLFRKQPHLSCLIALGASASLGYSVYAAARILFGGKTDFTLYFADAGTILALGAVGKYLEACISKKTGEALEALSVPEKTEVTVFRGGRETVIPSDQLQEGDTVLLRPGDSVPADGKILEGNGCFEESSLTGKSLPKDLQKGEFVFAGTLNRTGNLKFLVQRTADGTGLSRIEAFAERTYASKAPTVRTADKAAALLLPAVLAISFISAAVWLFISKDFETALKVGISVLILACPGSLGLAVPTVLATASGKGAEKGVLFRSPEALELCGRTDTVVFDKTGVLTEGKPTVNRILPREGDEKQVLVLLASLYSGSKHPLGGAVAKEAGERGLGLFSCKDLTILPGKGVSGTVNGKPCRALSLDAAGELFPAFTLSKDEKQALYGKTALCCFEEDRCVGLALLGDRLKHDSRSAVKKLKEAGISCLLLSGDSKESTASTGKEADIPRIFSQASPGQKEGILRELRQNEKIVAFVGVSADNAPALAAADVGFTLGSGAGLLLKNADVLLKNGHPSSVCTALFLSRKALHLLKENLLLAFLFNGIGIGLAVAGRLPPRFAALVAGLSSLCMVFNALRLRRFKETSGKEKIKKN